MRFVSLILVLASSALAQSVTVTLDPVWSYNTAHPSALSNGDTWGWNLNSGGITYMGGNDGTGINASNNSNMFFLKFTDGTMTTASLVNAMTNYGTVSQTGIGQCNGTSPYASTQKTSGMVSVGGTFFWWNGCQLQGGVYPQENVNVLMSTNQGTTWCRPQDQTCTGSPVPTTSMWSGVTLMGYAAPIQYCADNSSCGVSVDSAGTYLNILNIAGDSSGMYASRIAYTDLSANWYTATKYAAWQGGSSWTAWNGSTFGTPANVQCIVGGITRNCTSGLDFSPAHLYVVWLPSLNLYVMTTDCNGVLLVWTASTFVGPYTQVAIAPSLETPASSATWPLAVQFVGVAQATITQVGTSPVAYSMQLLYGGRYTYSANYAIYTQKMTITAATAAPLNTGNKYSGGLVSQFPNRNLWGLWAFDPADASQPLKDYAPARAHPLPITAATTPVGFVPLFSQYGLESGDLTSAVTANYTGANATNNFSGWSILMPAMPSLGDFSYFALARVKGTPTTNACLFGLNNYASGAGFGLYRSGASGTMDGLACSAIWGTCASVITVANLTDGNWFGLIFQRSGSTVSLYTTTTQTNPVTASGFGTAFTPTYETINSFTNSDNSSNSTNYGSYEIAAMGMWTGALTATERSMVFRAAQRIAKARGFSITY